MNDECDDNYERAVNGGLTNGERCEDMYANLDEPTKEITPSPRWKLSKESDFLITPEKAWENFDGIYKRKLERLMGIKI